MLSAYPACFFKEESGYTVIFPDLNSTATCGATIEEAFAMAIDCMAGCIYTLQLEKEALPVPSVLAEVSCEKVAHTLGNDYLFEEAFVNMVTVDVMEYAKIHFNKSVKKTLTIPEWMNNAARNAGINFSQVLQEALLKKLSIKK